MFGLSGRLAGYSVEPTGAPHELAGSPVRDSNAAAEAALRLPSLNLTLLLTNLTKGIPNCNHYNTLSKNIEIHLENLITLTLSCLFCKK